jgi:ribosomal protein S18
LLIYFFLLPLFFFSECNPFERKKDLFYTASKNKNINVLITLLSNNIKIEKDTRALNPEKKKFFSLFSQEKQTLPITKNVELLKKYIEERTVWNPNIHFL